MTATSANRDAKGMSGEVVEAGLAANTTVYKGTLAGYNSSGYVETKDASGNAFAGVFLEGGKGTTTNGETKVLIARKGIFEMEMSGAGLGTIGDELYIVDNQTVAATGTHKVGRAAKYENSGKIFIDIGGYC